MRMMKLNWLDIATFLLVLIGWAYLFYMFVSSSAADLWFGLVVMIFVTEIFLWSLDRKEGE